MTRADRALVVARKAVELGLREIGLAPDMVQARRLTANLAPPPSTGRRVSVFTLRDWSAHVQWEALLAHALRLRGASVSFVSCGGGLEICDRANTYESPPPPCHTCAGYVRRALRAHGFEPDLLTELASESVAWPELERLDLGELRSVEWDGVPLGDLVEIPVQWFLCTSDLERDPSAADTYRRFLRAARRVLAAIEDVLDRQQPDVVVAVNGLFFFEAILGHVARRRDIRVVTYERGFRQGTLFFSDDVPATRYWIPESAWEAAKGRPLDEERERRLDDYLEDRRHGRGAHVDFWPEPQFEDPRLAVRGRRRLVAFANLTWDSAVLKTDRAFPSMPAWLFACIEALGDRADVELVIRLHPAEVRIPGARSREPVEQVIRGRFPRLPSNVVLVGAEDPMSSYSLMERSDAGLVYSSTTGLEMALAGRPVIVAGEAHYRNRGFTVDVDDEAGFGRALDAVVADPDRFRPDQDLARRYADLFFFAHPFEQPPTHEPVGGLVRIDPDAGRRLEPGDPQMDRLCRMVLGTLGSEGPT